MPTIPSRLWSLALLLLLGAAWLGCAKDEPSVLDPSSSSLQAARMISGRLLGPDGRNICRTIDGANDATMFAALLNPDFDGSNDAFLGFQELTCPDNRYSFEVDASTAHLRVELPASPTIDELPWRNLDQFSVPPGGTNHNVNLVEGTELGGRATLDGNPFEGGAPLTLAYDFNNNFGAAFGFSGPGGRWTDFFGRSPMILQEDIRYQAFGCTGNLGTRELDGFPTGSFLFPSQRRALNCRLETAPATEFSHTFTRLVVTPMPGDIGGAFSSDFFEELGVGWGVQFPIPPGSSPSHGPIDFSEIFNGGLLIGIGGDQVLAGADAGSMMECGASCRDLGLDGMVTFTPTGARGERKHVTWRYSDAGSAEGVGLEVVQHSLDGKRPHDYVLFRFNIRNTSPSTLTFHAGFFGDWDLQFDAFDDLGRTAMAGRLMYQVSETERGIHAGTLLLGEAPIAGNYFFAFPEVPSTVDQIRALSGRIRRRMAGPDDLRYIHGVGPITLRRGQAQDVWLAVVAGENRTQLLANAEAARVDVTNRLTDALSDPSETSTITPSPRRTSRTASRPVCKSCRPQ